MNHMQVYEDTAGSGLDHETIRDYYFDEAHKGGMDGFSLRHRRLLSDRKSPRQ